MPQRRYACRVAARRQSWPLHDGGDESYRTPRLLSRNHEPIDPGKARRAASGIPIVPAFDGFRGIAILAIVVFHTLQNAAIGMGPEDGAVGSYIWAIDPGQSALNALFITSGFVMFLPIVARDGKLGSIRAFAMRRAAPAVSRLLPGPHPQPHPHRDAAVRPTARLSRHRQHLPELHDARGTR